MLKWITIALRNIIKNRRRSLATLLAISLGFAAVSLFYGYTSEVFKSLRNAAIHGEGLGHLNIYKAGWQEQGKIDPGRYMFTQNELQRISRLVEEEGDVVLCSPQIYISGLVTNGNISTIFLGKGVVPEHDAIIQSPLAQSHAVDGTPISSDKEYQVEMARDLARQLKLEPGDDAVVMGVTLDGQMNALDIVVGGIYDTGSAATNDKFIRLPYHYAQALYDTDKTDRVVVLLKNLNATGKMRDRLQEKLDQAGIDTEIKTWKELSAFYLQVKGMFSMIFMFIFSIVFVIVVMSVINTMTMAVVERTREIGTLRALGLKRRGVNLLFGLEGGILGILGSSLGVLLFLVVWTCFHFVAPSYVPPNGSTPVTLSISLVPRMMLFFFLIISCLSMLAALIPARKACKQSVVDALANV